MPAASPPASASPSIFNNMSQKLATEIRTEFWGDSQLAEPEYIYSVCTTQYMFMFICACPSPAVSGVKWVMTRLGVPKRAYIRSICCSDNAGGGGDCDFFCVHFAVCYRCTCLLLPFVCFCSLFLLAVISLLGCYRPGHVIANINVITVLEL